jgi:lysozyme
MSINGDHFVNKPTVILTWTGQPGYTLPSSQVTFVSASQLTISIRLGAAADNWSVKVINADGKASGTVAFTVEAPNTGSRVFGVDVSAFQGVLSPSQWADIKSQNKTFAWIRGTKGMAESSGDCEFLDATFNSNIEGAKAAGLIPGAYHVANVVQYRPEAEAAFFVAKAGAYLKPGNLRPALDIEQHSCGNPATLGLAGLSDWIDRWMKEVKRLTGVTPILYCNQNFLVNLDPILASKYDIWIAQFTGNPESAINVSPWNVWSVFQYTENGSAPGIASLDLDVFRGTIMEFQQKLVIPTPNLTGVGGGGVKPPQNGSFSFEIHTDKPQVTMQWSDDLVIWHDMGDVSADNHPTQFTDSNITGFPNKFYRIKP